MQQFEYKAIAAPTRARRFKGVKGTADRFAMVISETMNDMAADGWEYLRSDSLPVQEKTGLLKGRIETYQTLLIFRRAKEPAPEMAGFIEDHSGQPVAGDPTIPPAPPLPQEPAAPAVVQADENFAFPQDPPITSDTQHTREIAEDGGPFGEPRR